MAFSDLLNALFTVGSAAAGSQSGGDGGTVGGIFNVLGNIFGDKSSTGYSPSAQLALGTLGNLASRFQATPAEGATEEDIKKANRYNLIAGLLGAGSQFGADLMRQQEGNAMTKELGDILSGRKTTTGQAITPSGEAIASAAAESPRAKSEQIFGLMERYPSYNQELLKLGTQTAEKEAEQSLKQMDVLRKAMTGGLREVDLYNIAESRGILPEDRAAWVERERQKKAQEGLASLGLMGLESPKQSAFTSSTQTTTPSVPQGNVVQDILRNADQGKEFDITVAPDQAESVLQGLKQGGYQEQPATAKPNFASPEEQRGVERRQEQETRTKRREEGKAFLDFYAINKEPFAKIQYQAAEAPKTYDTIVSQLMSDDPSVQQNGLTTLLAARDESVVQIGELDRFNETVYTPLEKLNRQAQGWFLNKRVPLPVNIRDALIASAKDVRDIKMQAGDAADQSIRKASEENAAGNRKISGISEYRKNYKSIRDWLGEKNATTASTVLNPVSGGSSSLDAQIKQIQEQLGPGARFIGVR